MLLSNEWAENCIETYIYNHTTKSQMIYWGVLVTILISFIALPFIYVDISVKSDGIVRPTAEKTEVKAPISQIVKNVYVQEGEQVEKGEAMLSFISYTPEIKISYQQELLKDYTNNIIDLETLARGHYPHFFRSQTRQQEYNAFLSKKQKAKMEVEHAQKDHLRNKKFFDMKLISEEEYDQYRYDYQNKEQELASLVENQLSTWQSDLNSYRNQYQEMLANIEQEKANIKEMYVVRSPINGTIDLLTDIYAGSSLQAGQTIAIVSPTSSLYIEAYVSPNDIGYIHMQTRIKVQVASFNYNEWGTLTGKVTSISSDYMTNEQGTPYYLVKCKIDKSYLELKKTGIKGYLKKGMNVSVHFIVTRRTLFDLLYQNIDEWMNPTQYHTK